MQSNTYVLFDPIIERRRSPGVGEKYHAYCLSKVIQLKTSSTDGIQYGRIWHTLCLDPELSRSENEIRVRGSTKGVADHQEGYVLLSGSLENIIAASLYSLAIGDNYLAAVKLFLDCTLECQYDLLVAERCIGTY